MRTSDLDSNIVGKAYPRWAAIRDAMCGPIGVNGRRAAAKARCTIGGRIFEVGVDTGLSFDDYHVSTEIPGIDLWAPTPEKVRGEMVRGRYPIAAVIEQWLGRRICALGLRPEFSCSRLQAWAKATRGAMLVERRKLALHTLIGFERTGRLAA
jgi:hypothetical protein